MENEKSWRAAWTLALVPAVGVAILNCGSSSGGGGQTAPPGSDASSIEPDASTSTGQDGALSTNDASTTPRDGVAPTGDASDTGSAPHDSGPPADVAMGSASAPSNFLMTAETQNSISLQWNAATAGDNPIDHYKIYRNGSSYATSKTTSYTDTDATNATSPDYSSPISIYTYAVSAVDTKGNEGALQSKLTYWFYNTNTKVNDNPAPGVGGIPGNFVAGNFTCGTPVMNDTSGDPGSDPSQPGGSPYDFKFSGCGYNQPFSGAPTVPNWALSLSPFSYLVLDIKLTQPEPGLGVDIISRVPPGDMFNGAGVGLDTGKYGPVPVVGEWATYKVPLTALSIGVVDFVGSISGSLLTVTSIPAGGVTIQNSMWVIASGVPEGTYVTQAGPYDQLSCATGQTDCGSGGVGTYILAVPGNTSLSLPAGTHFTGQRYDNYKMPINVGDNDVYYINNIGFTSE